MCRPSECLHSAASRPATGPVPARPFPLAQAARTLALLASVAALGLRAEAAEDEPPSPLARVIENTVRHATWPLDLKIETLKGLEGELRPGEAWKCARLLKETEWDLMAALAQGLAQVGGADEVLAVMKSLALDRSCPVSRWAPAFGFVYDPSHALYGPDDQVERIERRLVQCISLHAPIGRVLLERIENPKDDQELLDLLRARKYLWGPQAGFATGGPEIVRRLCALVSHPKREVRACAAEALAAGARPEEIPGSTAIALAKVVQEADEPAARASAQLLRDILAIDPEDQDLGAVRAFWSDWARKAGEKFDLARYALARAADRSKDLTREDRWFLGKQVLYASEDLPPEAREAAWQGLRKLFEQEAGLRPSSGLASAWLGPMIRMAGREKDEKLRDRAAAYLLQLTRSGDPELRHSALSLFGYLPGATRPGTAARALLDQVLGDEAASPEERARAAWALRDAVKTDRALAERLIALAQTFEGLPDDRFQGMTRTRCIGLICGALSEASGRGLGLDPYPWRSFLKEWLEKLPR